MEVLAPLVVESATLQLRVRIWLTWVKVTHDPRFCGPLTVMVRPRHVSVDSQSLSRFMSNTVLLPATDEAAVSTSVNLPATLKVHELPKRFSTHVLPVPLRKSMVPEPCLVLARVMLAVDLPQEITRAPEVKVKSEAVKLMTPAPPLLSFVRPAWAGVAARARMLRVAMNIGARLAIGLIMGNAFRPLAQNGQTMDTYAGPGPQPNETEAWDYLQLGP